jgi:hypothetical protein
MRYVATGRVHPERADISFSPVSFRTGSNGRVVAQCDSSQLSVLLEIPDIDGWKSAQITAEHFAYLIVSALGFALGSGYSVEVIQVLEEDGTPHVFGVRPGTLEFDPNNLIFNRALHLAAEDVFFRLALRDYVRAITDSIDCATYCYRAIESVKFSFVFKTGRDSWDDMHAVLGSDRYSIEREVKRFADPVRHGNWIAAPATDGATRLAMLAFTRNLLSKFLDYAKPDV